jgi:hypothetical protein
MPFAAADRVRLHYEKTGSGSTDPSPSLEDARRANLTGAFLFAQAVAPAMALRESRAPTQS